MRPVVVVYEHVTAGGVGRPGAGLFAEGLAMADALVRDLRDDGRAAVRLVRDANIPVPSADIELLETRSGREALQSLDRACRGASLAFVIAPETEGALEMLTRRVAALDVAVAGASAAAVAIAASKRHTAAALAVRGVAVVPCYAEDTPPPAYGRHRPWVVKSDDGAGCEHTVLAASWAHALRRRRELAIRNAVFQPYLKGEPLSLSCFAGRDGVRVLSVNRQHVECRDDTLHFRGVTVGLPAPMAWSPEATACAVAEALPGLRGAFGIDLLLEQGSPVIVEVNPRLTTSFASLREVCGINVATLALDELLAGGLPRARDREAADAM
jgi:predicted ATP-grasp superfamily ATP-dependent carboligase